MKSPKASDIQILFISAGFSNSPLESHRKSTESVSGVNRMKSNNPGNKRETAADTVPAVSLFPMIYCSFMVPVQLLAFISSTTFGTFSISDSVLYFVMPSSTVISPMMTFAIISCLNISRSDLIFVRVEDTG